MEPPKCAFTKEEIVRRYSTKTKIDSFQDRILTGIINHRHERQIRVTSEWITVRGNQYTNIEQLNERFFLSTVMDDKKEEEYDQNLYNHFLMGLSLSLINNITSFSIPIANLGDQIKQSTNEMYMDRKLLRRFSVPLRLHTHLSILSLTEIFSTVTIRKVTLSRTSTTATTKESTTSKIIPSYADNTTFSEPSTEIVETSSTT
ncbi:hypothetical protein DICVIV_12361 [Dictyocaulus viviparus]|uniref:Uncharacterized protein n=1 Tax=Dictyocaulus viviparus TaxID=29172 RepID=A0A0D8XDD7_DICVI|nr:hypothetical protein DICVIV_12361 [Dictyocaulus viviparus]